MRMRDAVDLKLAPTFISLSRTVLNSDLRRGPNGPHEDVGGAVEDEAQLVGQRAGARQPVASQLALVKLDHVLGPRAHAVRRLVDLLRRRSLQRGDHEAPVDLHARVRPVHELAPRGKNSGDDAALGLPRLGAVEELAVRAPGVVQFGSAHPPCPRVGLADLLPALQGAVLRNGEM